MNKIIIILTLLLSMNLSHAERFGDSARIDSCNYSSDSNIKSIVEDAQECLETELSKETENNALNSQILEDVPSDLKKAFDFMMYFNAAILAFLIGFRLYESLNPKVRGHKSKKIIDTIIRASLMFGFATIVSDIEISKKVINTGYVGIEKNIILPLEVYNKVKQQSDIAKQRAIEANQSTIANKIIGVTRSMVNTKMCVTAYETKKMSSYGQNDIIVDIPIIDRPKDYVPERIEISDPLLDCISEFEEMNKHKTISDLGNRMLSSASVAYCSNLFDGNLIDCGSQYFHGDSALVPTLLNEYAIKISDLTNTFHEVKCKELEDKGLEQTEYKTFCRDYDDFGILYIDTESAPSLEEFETSFSELVEEFVLDYSAILESEIMIKNLPQSDSELYLTSLFDQALTTMKVENQDDGYTSSINERLGEINSTKPTKSSFYNGSDTDDEITHYNHIESTDDYFTYLNSQIQPFFDDATSFASQMLKDYAWVTDPKLLNGYYNGEDYVVFPNVIASLQNNKATIFALGTGIKFSTSYLKQKFKDQGKPLDKISKLETLGVLMIFISFLEPILLIVLFSIIFSMWFPMLASKVIRIFIKFFSVFYAKFETVSLADEVNELWFNASTISASIILPIVGTSIFAVLMQEILDNIWILTNNYNLLTAITYLWIHVVLQFIYAFVFIWLIYFTINKFNTKQKSEYKNIDKDPKSYAQTAKKLLGK
ncbi:conserved membrane hypothetical protein [Vibrio crassostreae]|uniref:hypothetical protein n=1 Tax=Vibrio crassostreae TaxID=246167 RepID=UPI001049E53C|nr:hypothetical protein [Vibrio crassostreae]TCT63734.1 hypothetical protein EDB40_101226 [Vibrio crassostreae]CAK2014358.1 conserved membrane hypothetical protein [Vibrio crassostreae]CAK2076670.1 conserved membrane hypothetical protein [Vibrio crassostreae]CAK2085113.1 conserved membrane hypothetical protein [Vibrio crassostreae]CAK2143205.1 conserved membrane hypothetical protein [Vibrio crassostreae]